MKKETKKATSKMKSKRPHYQHQGQYGTIPKEHDTISSRLEIDPMSDQKEYRRKLQGKQVKILN